LIEPLGLTIVSPVHGKVAILFLIPFTSFPAFSSSLPTFLRSFFPGLVLIALLLAGGAMGQANDLMDGFPRQIPVGPPGGVVYEQKPGYVALHGGPLPAQGAVVVFEPEGIAILRGSPPAGLSPGQVISPVYGPKEGEGLAAPTGQIFIRFREGERAEAHRAALERAGFSIALELDHAPQAAWLRARSGSIAEALSGASRLRTLPGVESVEVQLLMQRQPRQPLSGRGQWPELP
jgi:hypothetical protein